MQLLVFISWIFMILSNLPTSTFGNPMPPGSIETGPLPISKNPNITYLQPQYFPSHHPIRAKINYGPYTVPPSTIDSGMMDYFDPNVTAPCINCLITFIQVSLEYEDGTIANANTGLWLHHAVLYNHAQRDLTCTEGPQRLFASGNERSEANICVNGTRKTGLLLPHNTTLGLYTELMNNMNTSQTASIAITYEYLPHGPHSFTHALPIWLDITGTCGPSDYNPPANTPQFSVTMIPPWLSPVVGEVVWGVGHIHDGGTSLLVTKNNLTVCDSAPTYGGAPGYIDPPMEDGGMGGVHISNMSICENIGRIGVGDQWSVKETYDFNEYMPMVNSTGGLSPVMGIALLYIAVDKS